MEVTVNNILDAKGLACPMLIVNTKIEGINVGGVVTFLSFAKDADITLTF